MKLLGWDKLKKLLKPETFTERLHREVKIATQQNALLAEGAIKRAIASGVGPANAAVTVSIKGSSRQLVRSGILSTSITGKAERWDRAIIGVLRSRRVKSAGGKSKDVKEIAAILYFGATVKVTLKMRKLFFALSREDPKHYKPIKKSTTVIVIPPRPYLDAALTQPMIAEYRANWDRAIAKALAGGLG